MVLIKVGYNDELTFDTIEDALESIGSRIKAREAEKMFSLSIQVIDEVEYQWNKLPQRDKDKYVSLEAFREGVEKTEWHYEIEKAWETYKKEYQENPDNKEHQYSYKELIPWLKEQGLDERWLNIVNIELQDTMPDLVESEIEFGTPSDYREGDQ